MVRCNPEESTNSRPFWGIGNGPPSGVSWPGHGTALIQATLSEARRVGLVRFELTVHADNERAIALYKKVGFKKEGTMKYAALIDGHYKDVILMAIVDCGNGAPEKFRSSAWRATEELALG
jgi:hypothetical protein